MYNSSLIVHPSSLPKRRPKRPSKMPSVVSDPWRRFIAAFAAQAVIDARWPEIELSAQDHASALQFVRSDDGRTIIRELDIPVTKITALVSLLEEPKK